MTYTGNQRVVFVYQTITNLVVQSHLVRIHISRISIMLRLVISKIDDFIEYISKAYTKKKINFKESYKMKVPV